MLATDTTTETTFSTAPGPVLGKGGVNYYQDPGSLPDSGPTFRGNPVYMGRCPNLYGSTGTTTYGRGYESFDGCMSGNATSTRCGPLFDHTVEHAPLTACTRPPTRFHPNSDKDSIGPRLHVPISVF
jgi:hypothetical protein